MRLKVIMSAINVNPDTYSRLFGRKRNGKESMDSVIKRLLDRDTPGFDPTTEDKRSQDNRFLLQKTTKIIIGIESDISKLIRYNDQTRDALKVANTISELKKELISKGEFK